MYYVVEVSVYVDGDVDVEVGVYVDVAVDMYADTSISMRIRRWVRMYTLVVVWI